MHDNHRKQSFWRTLMEVLSRYVRSFSKGLRPIKGNATTETTQAVSVPHLIDPKQLEGTSNNPLCSENPVMK
jgi:hypothetical protein